MAKIMRGRIFRRGKKCQNCSLKMNADNSSPSSGHFEFNSGSDNSTIYAAIYKDEMKSIAQAASMVRTSKKSDLKNYESLLNDVESQIKNLA